MVRGRFGGWKEEIMTKYIIRKNGNRMWSGSKKDLTEIMDGFRRFLPRNPYVMMKVKADGSEEEI
jgi:hypothetical protein